MQSATTTFFSTVELVEHLWHCLYAKEFVRLLRTCSTLEAVCSPILWRDIVFDVVMGFPKRDIDLSIKRLKALTRQGCHVRSLRLDAIHLNLYVNGIAGAQDPTSAKRPDWLSAPNPRNCLPATVWVSSITQLTRLVCSLLTHGRKVVPGVKRMNFNNRLRQLCWLLELNPGLGDLTVAPLNTITLVDKLLFARAIARLTQLKHAQVEFRVDEDDESFLETLTMLFFCFPASLVSLKLKIVDNFWPYEDYALTPTVYLYTILGSLILRDGPLLCLRELELPILKTLQLLEYDRILEHCPNITTLSVVLFDGNCVSIIPGVAASVKEHCHHIRHIRINDRKAKGTVWDPFLFLNGTKSLDSLLVEGYHRDIGNLFQDRAISALRRHSMTLMDICLYYCDNVDSEIAVTILTTCAALKSLKLKDNYLPVRLPELVAHKWVCTGLKYLQISIDWGRFRHPTPSHLPAYYLQSWDRSPSDQDKERWNLLERLYRQIGSLVELEVLNMVASEGHMDSNPYRSSFEDTNVELYRDPGRFPLLFSLGVHEFTGRRGYLSWLAGLKNLKVLRGSVHLGNPEVAMTLKRAELEWMLVHWPKLKVLALLPPPVQDYDEPYDEIPFDLSDYPHIEWLIEQRPKLDIHRKWTGSPCCTYLWTRWELDDLMKEALSTV